MRLTLNDYWMIIGKGLETLMTGERWNESLKDHSIGFKDIDMLSACVYSPLMAAAAWSGDESWRPEAEPVSRSRTAKDLYQAQGKQILGRGQEKANNQAAGHQ